LMADAVCPTTVGLTTVTIADYAPYALGTGGSCHIGALDFSNFYFGSTASAGATKLSPTQIGITTIDNGPSGVGFSFAPISGLQVSSPNNIDVQVGFTVMAVGGGAILDDLGIGFNGTVTGSGLDNFTETYCFGNESPLSCTSGVTPPGIAGSFAVTNPPPNFSNAVTFASPVAVVTVLKDVGVATGTAAGTAAISAFGNTFSYVPEPTYTALLGLGLLGLGWLKRRRQSQE